MTRIRCYSVNIHEPTHCAYCEQPLSSNRWEVLVNGKRRVTCSERHAKDIEREWDLSPELPFRPPEKEPGSLPQLDD